MQVAEIVKGPYVVAVSSTKKLAAVTVRMLATGKEMEVTAGQWDKLGPEKICPAYGITNDEYLRILRELMVMV